MRDVVVSFVELGLGLHIQSRVACVRECTKAFKQVRSVAEALLKHADVVDLHQIFYVRALVPGAPRQSDRAARGVGCNSGEEVATWD